MVDNVSITKFINDICSVCGICKNKNSSPNFCYMVYTLTPVRFIKNIVRAGKTAQISKTLSYDYLNSFSGFIEMFCKTEVCPANNEQCKTPNNKALCFIDWKYGENSNITKDELNELLLEYQRIQVQKNNGELSKINTAWVMLSKKKKKKINNVLKRLLSLSNNWNKTNKQKSEEKSVGCTTTIFYSTNEEWTQYVKKTLNII